MCGGGFDEREIECEEAVSRLLECCPTLDHSRIYCHIDGCNGATSPTLTLADSMCILNRSCGSITSADVCDRVERLASSASQGGAFDAQPSSNPSSNSGVCP